MDMTTNAIYELPFPLKLVLERKEADIMMHCLCKYFHNHGGYNIVPAKLVYTNGGHRLCVCGKVKSVNDKTHS